MDSWSGFRVPTEVHEGVLGRKQRIWANNQHTDECLVKKFSEMFHHLLSKLKNRLDIKDDLLLYIEWLTLKKQQLWKNKKKTRHIRKLTLLKHA